MLAFQASYTGSIPVARSLLSKNLLPYFLAFVVCALPRVLFLFRLWGRGFDQDALYWQLSGELLQTGVLGFDGRPTTWQDPLYILFLAAARWFAHNNASWVMLMQILVASVGGGYLYRLALRLSNRPKVAAIAVFLYAFHPYLIRQSIAILEVSLLGTLLIVSADAYVRIDRPRRAALAGLFFGLAVLARSVVFPVAVLGSMAVAFLKNARWGAIFLAAVLIVICPSWIRNFSVDGSLWPTRGGLSFFVANCKYSGRLIPQKSTDLLVPYAYFRLDNFPMKSALVRSEREEDRDFTKMALGYICRHPFETLKQKIFNFYYFFSPVLIPHEPTGGESRNRWETAICFWFHLGLLLFAALGILWRRRRWREDLILSLSLMVFALVSSVYSPATRLRAPVEFVLIFYAAVAVDRMLPILTFLRLRVDSFFYTCRVRISGTGDPQTTRGELPPGKKLLPRL